MGVRRNVQEREGLKRPDKRGSIQDSLALKWLKVIQRKRALQAAAKQTKTVDAAI
jgi:hypothetical protein